MAGKAVPQPQRRKRPVERTYTDDDIRELRCLVYVTPSLRRLLDEPHDHEDNFRQHLLGIVVPLAVTYDRLMRDFGGNPSGVEFRHHDRETWAFVLPDASEGDRWRVQYFDVNGFFSHHTVDSLEQAVNDMVTEGYTVPSPGDLDRMAATPTWSRGMAVTALIQQLGAGLIDYAEFLRRQALLGPAKAA